MISPKIKIFIGSGGVGKTSLSVFYAYKLSKKHKVKLITFDPSKRLKDFFNMMDSDTEKVVSDNLLVSLGNRKTALKSFLKDFIPDQKTRNKVLETKIFQSLLGDLSVSQDFTSLYELVKSHSSETYDYIVIDTPPLHNSSSFLQGAKTLEQLFSAKVFKFMNFKPKSFLISGLIDRSRSALFKTLGRLTGQDFVSELILFFENISPIRIGVLKVLREADKLIEEAELNLVCAYNELSLRSNKIAIKNLTGKGFHIADIFINKYFEGDGAESLVFEDFKLSHSNLSFKYIPKLDKEPLSPEALYMEFNDAVV